MNDIVKQALEQAVLSLDGRIKWAGEAAMVAKQNAHGRESELSDLHKQRKAINDFLGEVKPEPRVWDSLKEIPKTVRARSAGGEVWRFWLPEEQDDKGVVVTRAGEWLHNGAYGNTSLYKTAPFTEVLETK